MPNTKTCKLHGTVLKRMRVPIDYGYPPWDPAWDVQEKLFPNANSYILGGCTFVLGEKTPTHTRRFACPECRTALQAWKRQNP